MTATPELELQRHRLFAACNTVVQAVPLHLIFVGGPDPRPSVLKYKHGDFSVDWRVQFTGYEQPLKIKLRVADYGGKSDPRIGPDGLAFKVGILGSRGPAQHAVGLSRYGLARWLFDAPTGLDLKYFTLIEAGPDQAYK